MQSNSNNRTWLPIYECLVTIMTKTLETITAALQQKGIKDEKEIVQQLHVAGMLALVEAANLVISQTTMPTPLYRLQYDADAQNVKFQILEGRAQVPAENALDINLIEVLVSSLLKEKMPLLLEGKTG